MRIIYWTGFEGTYWNIDISFMALPYFSMGNHMRHNGNKQKIQQILTGQDSNSVSIIGLLFICVITTITSYIVTGEGVDMSRAHYGIYPLTMLSAYSGIALIVLVSKRLNNKALCYVGENSMIFFAIHQAIIMPVVEKLIYGIMEKLDIDSAQVIFVGGAKMLEFILVILSLCGISMFYKKVKLVIGISKVEV